MPAPKLIIHGGAGAITRENLSPKAWAEYSSTLSRIYRSTAALLDNGVGALDAATHAVRLFEDCKLFNCGKGAVFTRDGTIELEASVMVTHPYHKRYCAATLLSHVKHPIEFVREMLLRGEHDGAGDGNSGGDGDPAGGSGGAQGHCCLSGDGAERLAREWGLEMVSPKYFWTRKRWEQHRKGLGKPTSKSIDDHATKTSNTTCDPGECLIFGDDSKRHTQSESLSSLKSAQPLERTPGDERNDGDTDDGDDDEGWDGIEYLPQGTVGCVALDRDGAICVATSTGGLTNKLSGRIGDTPTAGAGFWAEEWESPRPPVPAFAQPPPTNLFPPLLNNAISTLQNSFLGECLPVPLQIPSPTRYHPINSNNEKPNPPTHSKRAVALSGTGNGDSFLRLSACHTAAAIVRFSPPPPHGLVPIRTLASAVNQIAGPGGELQRSAGERWGVTGEGEGGIIGIEVLDDGEGKGAKGEVVFDFNCGGMMRCWVDAGGRETVMVFREEY